jgi:hypothetical protein
MGPGSPSLRSVARDDNQLGEMNIMKALRHFLSIACLCMLAMAGAVTAQAQGDAYPSKPVRIISDSAPGSTPDVVLRLVADRLGQIWGQQVVAVNQPGAGGSIAARVASESAPDGYTLFMPALSTFASLPGRRPTCRSRCRAISSRSASRPRIRCSFPCRRRSASTRWPS